MRTQLIYGLLPIAFVFALASCKKEHPSTSGGTGSQSTPPVVTVLGTEADSVLLWKNGKASLIASLPGANYYSATALSSNGTADYIAGFEPATNSRVYPFTPVYWLNGVANFLPDTTGMAGNGLASAVAVSGGDVYVAGTRDYFSDSSDVPYSGNNGNYPLNGQLATVWKNGVPVSLPGFGFVGVADTPNFVNRTRQDYVTGLSVSGNDVYVSGGTTWDVVSHAAYWKNGEMVDLGNNLVYSNPSNNSSGWPQTTSIFAFGNDVYVTGTQTTTYGTTVAIYWKNGAPVFLSTDSVGGSAAFAAGVNGADIYFAGWQNIGNYSRAMVWKNGIGAALTGGDTASVAYAMVIHNNDVYVAGYTWLQFGQAVATYWKNGVETRLSNGPNGAIAYAISVQ
jgi:hypothetical protein